MEYAHSQKKFENLPETLGRMTDEDLSLLKLTKKDWERWLFSSNVQTPVQSDKEHKDSGTMTKSKEQNISPATNLKEMEIYVLIIQNHL